MIVCLSIYCILVLCWSGSTGFFHLLLMILLVTQVSQMNNGEQVIIGGVTYYLCENWCSSDYFISCWDVIYLWCCVLSRWQCNSAGVPWHRQQQRERLHSYFCLSRAAEWLPRRRPEPPRSTCRHAAHFTANIHLRLARQFVIGSSQYVDALPEWCTTILAKLTICRDCAYAGIWSVTTVILTRLRPIPVLGIGLGPIPAVSDGIGYRRYCSRYRPITVGRRCNDKMLK